MQNNVAVSNIGCYRILKGNNSIVYDIGGFAPNDHACLGQFD